MFTKKPCAPPVPSFLFPALLFAALAALPALSVLPQAARAQPSAPAPVRSSASPALEEIVVTARKREESLQETPLSISAFAAEEMQAANMIDLRDIGKYTPGMSFTSFGMGSSEAGAVFIRGIGQVDHIVTTDPGVGLYIDGVYVGRNQGGALDLLDIERVEVLRGPQGTLFGKNTIGGAVSVITRKPTGENGAYTDFTLGDGRRFNLAAGAEFALTERVAMRAGLLRKKRDGVGKQVFTGDESGDEDSLGARISLHRSGEASELTLTMDGMRARQSAVPHSAFALDPVQFPGISSCYRAAEPGADDPYPPCEGAGGGPLVNYSLDDLASDQDLFGVAATFRRGFGDAFSMQSITAYREMEYQGNLDHDGAPQRVVYYHETGVSEQFSQELQWSGGSDADALEWIAGLYYFTEEGHNLQDDYDLAGHGQRLTQVETESFAAFGQGTLELGARFSLALGARYTRESKDYDVVYRNLGASDPSPGATAPGSGSGPGMTAPPSTPGTPGTTPPAPAPGASPSPAPASPYRVPPSTLKETWDAFSGTLNLRYRLGERSLLYLSYARGFRSGGFAARPTQASSVGAYDPEFVNMYELGWKAQHFADRLRVNAALYFGDYEDYQAQVNRVGESFDTRTLNAAEAEISGAELELTALFSVFRLAGSYAYTNAEIDALKLAPTLQAGFAAGAKLPFVSRHTYSLAPQVELPTPGGGSLLLRADWSYRSAFFGQIANAPEERQGGYGLLNARIEFRAARGALRVALYGINLFDKRYARVRQYYPGFFGVALWNTDSREVGVSLRYEL